MRTRTLLLLVFMITLTQSPAQEGNQSKAILDKTYAAFKASKGVRFTFTLSTLDQANNPSDIQSGEAYAKGDKFMLNMEEMDVWFDGKTQWVLIKEVNEVNISQPTIQDIASISPLALLGIYKNGYDIAPPVSTTTNGKSTRRIDMTPSSSQGEFQSVSVLIDKINHTLTQVCLTHHNGLKTYIDITDYNANHHLADPFFTFDASAHPGVEIIDLR